MQPAFGNKVISLLGMPYVLPVYLDRRGAVTTFRVTLVTKQDGSIVEGTDVVGTKVAFGLVLHRRVDLANVGHALSSSAWIISEPTTGCRVVFGRTRQDALDSLAGLVAFRGGEDAFSDALDVARTAIAKHVTRR